MANANCHLGVEIKTVDAQKGRGLYSKTDFKTGDIILEESPLVSCQFSWNELYKYKACEFCLRSLETAEAMARRLTDNPALVLPQPECCEVKVDRCVVCPQCQVLYCCEECRQSAWNRYHKLLCLGPSREDEDHPTNKLLETWRNMHYPPETASIMLLLKMIAMVKQAEDPGCVLQQFSQFVSATINEEEHSVHKLLGAQFQEQLELLRSMVSEIFYDEKVQQWLTPEGFRSAFALMGTNQQGIGSSSISVWVKNCDDLQLSEEEREKLDKLIDQMYEDLEKVSGTFLNCEGSGLYTMQSSCNHSCVPNAEIQFVKQNNILTLVALQDIAPEEIRWVVESSNARIKSWKYLDRVLPTNQVPYIGDYIRIICAISNRYLPALNPTRDIEEDGVVAAQMRQRSLQVNSLQDYILKNSLDRRTVVWKRCDDIDHLCFPHMSEEKLSSITCGVYQLRLSSSYIQEYIEGGSDILVHKDECNLLRIQLQSRHVSAKKYLLWLQYNLTDVTAWYCKCRAGARVVGVCAHVAAMIWYLGSGRHQDKNSYGVQDWGRYVSDAGEPLEPVDFSDTDSSDGVVEE